MSEVRIPKCPLDDMVNSIMDILWMDEGDIHAVASSIVNVPLAIPENLARDLAPQVHDLSPENVGGFINVCLLGAVTGRDAVVKVHLKKPEWSALDPFIRKHFYHEDRPTYSLLNQVGLCILAVSGETMDAFAGANFLSTHDLVKDFRLKYGDWKSIWNAKIGSISFSEEQKAEKFSAQNFAEHGATIVKILNDKYQSGIKA